ncbi:MAG: hypothetical protein ACK2VD_13810 [Anaerolineae bacterium]|jgi:hypothetical protein
MNSDSTRSWQIVLVLCLVVLLAACGGTPTPEAETTSQPSTANPPVATSTPTATLTPAATVPAIEAATMTPTPTPTAWPVVPPATPTPAVASRCQGLAGTLEVQVLVGPAEAVGLEPVAVGQVPFAVTTEQAPYLLQGQAPIAYEATLEEAWGTYTVNMDLDLAVSGECKGEGGSESLDVVLAMNGDQLVVVDAQDFHGEYPWSGAHTLDLSFPLQEGATAQGEGWVVVLHVGA